MASCKFSILARSFSSSAVQSQMIKTPIPIFGIGGRYATALYSAAVKSKEIDKVEQDLIKFKEAMDKDKKFRQVLKDPTFKKTIKANVIESAAQKLSLTKSSTNLLKLLAENGRLKSFDIVLSSFKVVMAAHRGEIMCEVTSAKPLTDAQKKEIEAILKKFAKNNEAILLSEKVDPSIIGGLTVSIGDKFADMSIATKINKYRRIIETIL